MEAEIALHVRAAVRPRDESELLAAHLMRACWPKGHSDTSEPVARGWLRVWGPVKVLVALPHCGCAHGHCTICN